MAASHAFYVDRHEVLDVVYCNMEHDRDVLEIFIKVDPTKVKTQAGPLTPTTQNRLIFRHHDENGWAYLIQHNWGLTRERAQALEKEIRAAMRG